MKKISIVSTDVILAYQPTILNLYDQLHKYFDVEIISFVPRYISKNKILNRNVIYLSETPVLKQLYESVDFITYLIGKCTFGFAGKKYRNGFFQKKLIAKTLRRTLQNHNADEYVVVDFMALHIFQKAKPDKKCHFLSLEISEYDKYKPLCDYNKIRSVIIQTKDRYEYLFSKTGIPVFYIQNAPASDSFCFNPYKTGSLVWAGSILIRFGVLPCIDFIVSSNCNYQLTFKGGINKKTSAIINKRFSLQLQNKCLVIDTDYLETKEFIKYLSRFKIGFCFYDIELAKSNFNYRTAPSGKLFAYYAAGVPVIALDIPGLRSVAEFNAGILIKDYSFESIDNALNLIQSNYDYYFEGCKKAAAYYAFDKHCAEFINFINVK